ncbi:MAG: FAD-binding protein [Planctomycetia bacterium]|nr:FAD-binding protein [Planctomycetia bacterium]
MVNVVIIGSGAAGLASAVWLCRNGVAPEEILLVTEGLTMGTSINTGSDKQTYYRTSQTVGPAGEGDSPRAMAETLYRGGSMHGDIALVEASLSTRAFFHLVELGVPFPADEYGQYVGYRTDHDPVGRGSSVGPYTSRIMCESLIREVRRLNVPILERTLAVRILTDERNIHPDVDGVDRDGDDRVDGVSGSGSGRSRRVTGVVLFEIVR